MRLLVKYIVMYLYILLKQLTILFPYALSQFHWPFSFSIALWHLFPVPPDHRRHCRVREQTHEGVHAPSVPVAPLCQLGASVRRFFPKGGSVGGEVPGVFLRTPVLSAAGVDAVVDTVLEVPDRQEARHVGRDLAS